MNPDFGGVQPALFISGNDANAERRAAAVLRRFGREVEDTGAVEAARENRWFHAFKLLRK